MIDVRTALDQAMHAAGVVWTDEQKEHAAAVLADLTTLSARKVAGEQVDSELAVVEADALRMLSTISHKPAEVLRHVVEIIVTQGLRLLLGRFLPPF